MIGWSTNPYNVKMLTSQSLIFFHSVPLNNAASPDTELDTPPDTELRFLGGTARGTTHASKTETNGPEHAFAPGARPFWWSDKPMPQFVWYDFGAAVRVMPSRVEVTAAKGGDNAWIISKFPAQFQLVGHDATCDDANVEWDVLCECPISTSELQCPDGNRWCGSGCNVTGEAIAAGKQFRCLGIKVLSVINGSKANIGNIRMWGRKDE